MPCHDKSTSCELCVNPEVMQRNLDELLESYIVFQNENVEGKRLANPINPHEMQAVFSSFENNGFMSSSFQEFSEQLLSNNRPHECMLFIKFTTESAVHRNPDVILLGKCVEALTTLYCRVSKDNNVDQVFPVLVLRHLDVIVHRIQRFHGVDAATTCRKKFQVLTAFVKRIVEHDLQEHLEYALMVYAEISVWLTSLLRSFIYHMRGQTHLSDIFYGETINHMKEMHEPMKGLNLATIQLYYDKSRRGIPL